MDNDVELRPVTEGDLPILHQLTSDPTATGDLEWYGWQDPHRYRRRWEENGLLGDDGGTLMVIRGDDVLGLEKAGFTREWIMRGSGFQGGRWHDGVIYSMLRSEADLS